MKLGKSKIFFLFFILFSIKNVFAYADSKIKSVPLINLEELSPTFEEDKDELEKNDDLNIDLNTNESLDEIKESKKNDKYSNH